MKILFAFILITVFVNSQAQDMDFMEQYDGIRPSILTTELIDSTTKSKSTFSTKRVNLLYQQLMIDGGSSFSYHYRKTYIYGNFMFIKLGYSLHYKRFQANVKYTYLTPYGVSSFFKDHRYKSKMQFSYYFPQSLKQRPYSRIQLSINNENLKLFSRGDIYQLSKFNYDFAIDYSTPITLQSFNKKIFINNPMIIPSIILSYNLKEKSLFYGFFVRYTPPFNVNISRNLPNITLGGGYFRERSFLLSSNYNYIKFDINFEIGIGAFYKPFKVYFAVSRAITKDFKNLNSANYLPELAIHVNTAFKKIKLKD